MKLRLTKACVGSRRKGKRGQGTARESTVFGFLERDGRVYTKVVGQATADELMNHIHGIESFFGVLQSIFIPLPRVAKYHFPMYLKKVDTDLITGKRIYSNVSSKSILVTFRTNYLYFINMNWKILSIFIIVVIIAGVVGYFIVNQQTLSPVPIPTPTPNGEKIIRTVGEREGSFLIQKINPDSVEGLWFEIYPMEKPNDPGTPKTLYIGDDIGYACEGVSEKLTNIDFTGQKVSFTKVVGEPPFGGCPICLSGNTFIDTPNGNINIKELRSGMLVWTSDKHGYKQPAIILKIGKAQVPPTHKVIHVILNNGKELFVSQGHPTTDNRIFGEIKPGDIIDDSYVKSVKLVQYDQKYTYDILPSGDTGFYWANGILVGSTLK